MTVAAFVLGCVVAFCAGWLVRDLVLTLPRRRGGDVDLVGARPRDGWERRNAASLRDVAIDDRPLLQVVPEPRLRDVGVRHENGGSRYSAAWQGRDLPRHAELEAGAGEPIEDAAWGPL